jgi:hypothetical protein
MRLHTIAFVLIAACSHKNPIGPDDGGGDAALVDGATPDGSTGDGSSPDGGNAKGDQGYTAGSRLQVRYYVGSDGSEQAIGFYDTTRKENCYFSTATDSTRRCLPEIGSVLSIYSDSGCTTALIGLYKGCTPPAEVRSNVMGNYSCTAGYQYAVFTVGSAFTGATLYTGTTTNCNATSASVFTTAYDLYSATGTVAPSSFVDATEVVK